MESKSLFKIKPETALKVYRPVKTQLVPLQAHFPGFCFLIKSSPRIDGFLLIPFPFSQSLYFQNMNWTVRHFPLQHSLTDIFLCVFLLTEATLGFLLYHCYSGVTGTSRPPLTVHGSTPGRAIFPCLRSNGHPDISALCKLTGPAGMKSQGHWDRHWGTELCCLLHPTAT